MVNESEGYLSCVVNRSFYSALVLHSVMNGYVVSPRKSYTPYILQFYTESLSGEIKQPSPLQPCGGILSPLPIEFTNIVRVLRVGT